MSTGNGTLARTTRRALVRQARQRAVDLARDEAVRLDEDLQLAATALGAIRDRANARSTESARVRALGLECLPDSRYLSYCVGRLRGELAGTRSRRAWLTDARSWAGEIEALLVAAVDMTSTIDIAGELDVPLDLVVTVQSGARAGLSALRRLHDDLDAVKRGELPAGVGAATGAVSGVPAGRSTLAAQWLVQVASMLLPLPSRDRYLEEFTGELRELADAGARSGGQLAYALRLVTRAWALRRALPPAAAYGGTEPDRVRVPTRTESQAARRPARQAVGVRRLFDRWKASRDARAGMEVIAKQRRAVRRRSGSDGPAHAYRRRAERRSPITVQRRIDRSAGRRPHPATRRRHPGAGSAVSSAGE
jgi:hypothetical protein